MYIWEFKMAKVAAWYSELAKYTKAVTVEPGYGKASLSWLCPDSTDHGANMGPTWGRQDPGGPHVGPMNLAIRVLSLSLYSLGSTSDIFPPNFVKSTKPTIVCWNRRVALKFDRHLDSLTAVMHVKFLSDRTKLDCCCCLVNRKPEFSTNLLFILFRW